MFLRLGDSGDVRGVAGHLPDATFEGSYGCAKFLSDGRPEQVERTAISTLCRYAHHESPTKPRALRRVYQLDRSQNDVAEISRLRGRAAVESIIQNVYPPGVAARLGYQSRVLAVCASVARRVPVFRLSRHFELRALDHSIDVLENHLRDAS